MDNSLEESADELAFDPPQYRVWLDDERPAPEGFVHLRTAGAAIYFLTLHKGRVTEISLDHDLGPPDAGTGYDVACYIEEAAHQGWLQEMTVTVHSANPIGRRRIMEAIRKAQDYWRRRS